VALDLIAELEGVLAAFERDGVEYALCGGIALAIFKRPRFTDDIDILVLPEAVDAALASARTAGFDIPARKMVFGLASGANREIRRVSKLDPETSDLMTLDLLVVGDELVPVWDGRRRASWRGRDLAIVSREGLVTMKRIAGRPQDLVDITALETPDDEAP
jgi:hypothetical protein